MTPSDPKPKSKARSGNRVSTGLVALGSATVVAIYSAGFYKTKAAADRFAGPPMPGNPRGPIGIPGGPGGPGRGAPSVPGGEPSTAPVAGREEAGARGDALAIRASAPAVTLAIPTVPRVEAPAAPAKVDAARASSAPSSAVAAANDAPASVPLPAVIAPSSSSAPLPAPASQPPAASTTVPSPAPAAPAVAASVAPAPKFKDGTYTGWGTCRHGDIQARIEITGGRIVTSEIAQCLTRYSCSWISPLPPQVISRQSENVDYVSGATDSAIAFYWAVFDALSKAK